MKTCTKCKIEKPLDCFYTLKSERLYSWCVQCTKATAKQYRLADPEKYKHKKLCPEGKAKKSKLDAEYREKNKEKVRQKKREYYQKNKERIAARARANYLQSPEAAKTRATKWKSENRAKHNAQCMGRHTAKLQRTPAWVTESPDYIFMIDEAYDIACLRSEMTGVEHHVDHIIPLQGKTVSGLHVPWNLQILTASENCSKRNTVQL